MGKLGQGSQLGGYRRVAHADLADRATFADSAGDASQASFAVNAGYAGQASSLDPGLVASGLVKVNASGQPSAAVPGADYEAAVCSATAEYAVDPINGDDANDGTPAHPFKTLFRLSNAMRDLSAVGPSGKVDVVVQLLSDAPDTDPLLAVPRYAKSFTLVGTPQILHECALSAVSATDRGAAVNRQLEVTLDTPSAPYLDYHVRKLKVDRSVDSTAAILKSLGGNVARLGQPRAPGWDSASAWAPGDTVQVVSYPRAVLNIDGGVCDVYARNVDVVGNLNAVVYYLELDDCRLVPAADGYNGIWAPVSRLCNVHFPQTMNCYISGPAYISLNTISATGKTGESYRFIEFAYATTVTDEEDNVFQNATLYFGHDARWRKTYGSTGIFDVPAGGDDAITLVHGMDAIHTVALWGKDNGATILNIRDSLTRVAIGAAPTAVTSNATKAKVKGVAKTFAELAAGFWDTVHQCGCVPF